ncbi:MAG: DUF5318 domain-containing protein [Actinobacteria bacterium]|nr:DUF5318 domain-containing protein [Actinomycetota bacterium]
MSSFTPRYPNGSSQGITGHIEYKLARNTIVEAFKHGRLTRRDVCDAHPELLRAARYLGLNADEHCPICGEKQIVYVTYVFGSRLPPGGRCIASSRELARITNQAGEVACYVVEVCNACAWNHLVRMYYVNKDVENKENRKQTAGRANRGGKRNG